MACVYMYVDIYISIYIYYNYIYIYISHIYMYARVCVCVTDHELSLGVGYILRCQGAKTDRIGEWIAYLAWRRMASWRPAVPLRSHQTMGNPHQQRWEIHGNPRTMLGSMRELMFCELSGWAIPKCSFCCQLRDSKDPRHQFLPCIF